MVEEELRAAAAGKPTNEQITEVVLTAPLQGHQSVPVKRERQRRREATGDARSRGVKTSGAESDQPLGELLASRDEVDTLSASLCAVMSGVVQASARPPEHEGWRRGHAD